MADPRATPNVNNLDPTYATFTADNSTITYDATKARGAATTMLDKAVSLSADKTVQLASDGEAIVGRLDHVEPGPVAVVQYDGTTALPGGASATLTLGTAIVGALGAASAKGYIRSAASGTAAELIKCRGQIWDASDTTNVVVDF
jgi:hypothetical protein